MNGKIIKDRRGFFGIGIYQPKIGVNIGTLWRSAYIYGASFIFTIGGRYKKQASDTVYASRHIPLFNYKTYDEFLKHSPYDCEIICIEINDNSVGLEAARHPERAIYMLGAEDYGIPDTILKKHTVVKIPSERSYCQNVSVAGAIVMYDRYVKIRIK